MENYLLERRIPLLRFFGGGVTPLRFSDSAAEHLATRHAAGLFDFSFMGCFEFSGADTLRYLHRAQTRNLRLLGPNRIAYTLLCRPDGSVFIDATVWNRGDGSYWLFTGRREDFAELLDRAEGFDVGVDDLSGRHAVLALQGPMSAAVLRACLDGCALPHLPYFGFAHLSLFGQPCWIARLGFSGEFGYEIIVAANLGRTIWENLCSAGRPYGLFECGFEAADSLRIESGYILFANELRSFVTPFELGLARLAGFDHAEFIGAEALRRLRWRKPARVLVGIDLTSMRRVRPATAQVTSSSWSPVFRRRLGLGFVSWPERYPGSLVTTQLGEVGRVARLPFYDSPRIVPRQSP